jgi:hypothetical protein
VTAWNARDAAALGRDARRERCRHQPVRRVLEGPSEIERVYRSGSPRSRHDVPQRRQSSSTAQRVVPQIRRPLGLPHRGDFFGLAPTGPHVEVQVALVMKVADGLVVEERRIYDFTGVLVQVGVLKAKPACVAAILA